MSHSEPQYDELGKNRGRAHVVATLVFCTLLATVSAIVFGFVYGIVILTVVFGHPLFWFAGLLLGSLAGAIGGPVFGVAYGATLVRRGRAKNRGRSALLAGVLGGVIFAAVGAAFHAWEASERSDQPTKRPIVVNPESGPAVEGREPVSGSRGAVNASPNGGTVIERRNRAPESDSPRDAEILAGLLGNGLSPEDLMRIPKYHAYLRMLVTGAPHTFSMTTFPPPRYVARRAETVRRVSRQKFGQSAASHQA